MRLEGSCHCGGVRFSLDSKTPYPFMRCYCSICRKTGGGGGWAVNVMGEARTLEVEGEASLAVYRVEAARTEAGGDGLSEGRRHLCSHCGSALWVYDPRWPELVHPFASAIDTPLPTPPHHVHIMLDFKAPWVEVTHHEGDVFFSRYPDLSIEEWHRRQGLYGTL